MQNILLKEGFKCNRCISEQEIELVGDLKSNAKYLGCFKNVVAQVNEQCKLKSSCEKKVVDFESKDDNFCLPGMNKHLEVNYSCLKSKKALFFMK